jgi:hypothetical protein
MRIGTDPMRGPDSHYGQQDPWSGATLQSPQPVVPPAPPPGFPAPPAVAPPPAPGANVVPTIPANNGVSYEQAQTVLAAKGVAWQRLESGDQGDWKFTCSVPSKQNPAVSRTYEAHASTSLDAVRAVLDKMDKE